MNTNEPKYFMWGWQRHFWGLAESRIKHAFSGIEAKFKPFFFIIALDNIENPENLYFEPDEFDDLAYEILYFYKKNFEANILNHPRRDSFISNPYWQRSVHDDITYDCARKALNSSIYSAIRKNGFQIFTAKPAAVFGKYVFCNLAVHNFDYEMYYNFSDNYIHTPDTNFYRFFLPKSLIESISFSLLDQCHKSLFCVMDEFGPQEPDINEPANSELTGKKLFFRVSVNTADMHHTETHRQITGLSQMYYEGGRSSGKIVFAEKNSTEFETVFRFKSEIDMYETKKIRKLLELTKQEYALASNTNSVYSVVKFRDDYETSREDIYHVQFKGFGQWEFFHGKNSVCAYDNGKYFNLFRKIIISQLQESLEIHFGPGNYSRISSFIEELTNVNKGSLVIITDAMLAESERLSGNHIQIEKTEVTPEIARAICQMDGAIILNMDGEFSSIGTILDGNAVNIADISRGSRYNSAIKYVQKLTSAGNTAMGIVISDDSYVDLYPPYKPRIRKSRIQKHIQFVRQALEEEHPDYDKYGEHWWQLDELRGYLSSEECEQLNEVATHFNENHLMEGTRPYIRFSEFRVSPNYSEKYLIQDEED